MSSGMLRRDISCRFIIIIIIIIIIKGPTSKGKEERKDGREWQGRGEGRGGDLLLRRGEGRKGEEIG